MAQYVLIESRDPFESRDMSNYLEMASGLASKGHQVTVFLVENGVLACRKGIAGNPLEAALGASLTVVADDFSLRERGVSDDERLDGVATASIDALVDHMMNDSDTKVVWH